MSVKPVSSFSSPLPATQNWDMQGLLKDIEAKKEKYTLSTNKANSTPQQLPAVKSQIYNTDRYSNFIKTVDPKNMDPFTKAEKLELEIFKKSLAETFSPIRK